MLIWLLLNVVDSCLYYCDVVLSVYGLWLFLCELGCVWCGCLISVLSGMFSVFVMLMSDDSEMFVRWCLICDRNLIDRFVLVVIFSSVFFVFWCRW